MRKNVKSHAVTIDQFNELVKQLYSEGNILVRTELLPDTRAIRDYGRFRVFNDMNYVSLYYIDDSLHYQSVYYPKHGELSNYTQANNENLNTGHKAVSMIEKRIQDKLNDKSLKMMNMFSGESYKDVYTAIKKCVISPFDYDSPLFINKKVSHVHKADVSSAYPTQLMKKLPTLQGYKRLEGRIEPTEEYPFAYYINSRNLAIYDEFSTFDFKNTLYPYKNVISGRKWNPVDIPAEQDITILCKEASDTYVNALREVFQELYASRDEFANSKLMMNSFIGMLHYNHNPYCAHIAAVVIARCAHDMVVRCNKLEEEGSIPILVNTDSISWIGANSSSIIDSEKFMGAFNMEVTDTDFIIVSVKAYQFINKDGQCETRHSGISKSETASWKFGDILDHSEDIVQVRVTEEGYIEQRITCELEW